MSFLKIGKPTSALPPQSQRRDRVRLARANPVCAGTIMFCRFLSAPCGHTEQQRQKRGKKPSTRTPPFSCLKVFHALPTPAPFFAPRLPFRASVPFSLPFCCCVALIGAAPAFLGVLLLLTAFLPSLSPPFRLCACVCVCRPF